MTEAEAGPEVPGIWRLGWLLFFQPLKLHRLFQRWGFEGDPSLWALRDRIGSELLVRRLVLRMTGLLLILPMPLTLVAVGPWLVGGGSINWPKLACGLILGVGFGIIDGVGFGAVDGVVGGVVFGVAGGVAGGVIEGLALSVAGGVIFVAYVIARGVVLGVVGGAAGGISLGLAGGMSFATPGGVARGTALGLAGGAILGVAFGVAAGVVLGVAFGVLVAVILPALHLRVPFWPAHAAQCLLLDRAARLKPQDIPQLVGNLPYRRHDLIYFPLPALTDFLVQAGRHHPELAHKLLAEAAATIGQKAAAAEAQSQLQAETLTHAAHPSRLREVLDLHLTFWPSFKDLPENSPIHPFVRTAKDLAAEAETRDHAVRLHHLERAQRALTSGRNALIQEPEPSTLQKHLLPAYEAWQALCATREAALTAARMADPQVPDPFVSGPSLDPTKAETVLQLFKGRLDITELVDRDLSEPNPQALYLTGQRRMGKSSLLHVLPRRLGTGTVVVQVDFQGYSGHPVKDAPHWWLTTEVSKALDVPLPSTDGPWGTALEALKSIEATLTDRRVLITVDEVERLKDAAFEETISRATELAFLDFVRAAGQALSRIQIMLVSAFPIDRFPEWSDRLVSVRRRHLGYLLRDEGRELLVSPAPGFPDIYPPDPSEGVEHILDETRCQPALLQATGKCLVAILRRAKKSRANAADVAEALTQAMDFTDHLPSLWRQASDEEKEILQALAHGATEVQASSAREALVQEEFVERSESRLYVAVPLFARWIRKMHPI